MTALRAHTSHSVRLAERFMVVPVPVSIATRPASTTMAAKVSRVSTGTPQIAAVRSRSNGATARRRRSRLPASTHSSR